VGLAGQVGQGLVRHVRLAQPHFRQQAEQVSELRDGHQLQGAHRRGDQAVDDLGRGALPAGELGPDVRRVDRATVARELVVGDQHPVHPAHVVGQVQRPLHVDDLGFYGGQDLESGPGAQGGHGGHEIRHPWRVTADMVSQAENAEPTLPGGRDVLLQRAHRVGGERGVNVVILVEGGRPGR
jgi:hypothetical protein